MKPVHPFPARMAPDAVTKWLRVLPRGARVLDPMCGSGVVLKQAQELGHRATGLDIDPLAVLMTRVWTRKDSLQKLPDLAEDIAASARKRRSVASSLPWIKSCSETASFIDYWFAIRQRNELARVSAAMLERRHELSGPLLDGLLLCLSRLIVTKQAGASLAWDVSHSRPHRMLVPNDYDVVDSFIRAAQKVARIAAESTPTLSAVVSM